MRHALVLILSQKLAIYTKGTWLLCDVFPFPFYSAVSVVPGLFRTERVLGPTISTGIPQPTGTPVLDFPTDPFSTKGSGVSLFGLVLARQNHYSGFISNKE
jgi:hypothetical protein